MNKENVQENNNGKSCTTKGCSCKTKLVLIIALVLAIGAYVGFWHYQAGIIKSNVEQELAKPAFEGVKYRAVSVYGFPFKYNVEVQNPYYEFEYMGQNFRIEMDKIVLTSNISNMNNYKANLGDLSIVGDYVIDEDKKEQFIEKIKFNVPPSLEVQFDDFGEITNISYNDKGFGVLLNGKEVGSVERMNASFTKGSTEENKHFFNIRGSYRTGSPVNVKEFPMVMNFSEETMAKLLELNKKFGKANFDLDATFAYVGPENLDMEDPSLLALIEEVNLDVGKIAFKTESGMGYEISGNIGMEKNSFTPSVDLKLSLFNVDEIFAFVDDVVKIMPEVIEQNKGLSQEEKDANLAILEGLRSVDGKKLENVKAFLYEISDNPAEIGKDLTISVKSLEDGNMTVGTLNAMDAGELFEKRFNSEEGAVAPSPTATPAPEVAPVLITPAIPETTEVAPKVEGEVEVKEQAVAPKVE